MGTRNDSPAKKFGHIFLKKWEVYYQFHNSQTLQPVVIYFILNSQLTNIKSKIWLGKPDTSGGKDADVDSVL